MSKSSGCVVRISESYGYPTWGRGAGDSQTGALMKYKITHSIHMDIFTDILILLNSNVLNIC